MADIVNGQLWQVTFVGELSGSQILNTFHYKVKDYPGGIGNTKALADALIADLNTNGGDGFDFIDRWTQMLPPQYTLLQIWAQAVHPVRVRKEIYNDGTVGSWAADGHWANSAACITRKGELAGRKYISTLHVPIPSELDANAGYLPAGYLTAMNNFISKLLETQAVGALSLNLIPVIPHKEPAGSSSDVKSATAENTVRVMRRRTKFIGV